MDRKHLVGASASAAPAPARTIKHKRKWKTIAQIEEEKDAADDPAPDRTAPRGDLRRSDDVVDSDSDVDEKLADRPMRVAAARSADESMLADLKPKPMSVSLRSILMGPIPSVARAAEPVEPYVQALIAKRNARLKVFFSTPHVVWDTDVDAPKRNKTEEWEEGELASRVRFKTSAELVPVPPLAVDPISWLLDWPFQSVRAVICAMPPAERRRFVRRQVRAVNKRLWRQFARSLPRPAGDASTDKTPPPDPFKGHYLSHEAFSEYLLEHSGERELSEHDTPALSDTIHYLNPRIMRQVIHIAQQRADAGNAIARRTLALREMLYGLQEQSNASIAGPAEREYLRKSLREEVKDPAYTKAAIDKSKQRMHHAAWLRDVSAVEKDAGRRELDEALKQLLRVAKAVVRTKESAAAADNHKLLDHLKDDIMKTLNAKIMILKDAARGIQTPLDLGTRQLCCELQLELFAQFPKLQDQAYHRVLSDSRSTAVSLLCGGEEKEWHRHFEAMGITQNNIRRAAALEGQSLAFVLSLGHPQMWAFYEGFDFDPENVCYYADVECVKIVRTRVSQTLRIATRPCTARRRAQSIESMCDRLNTGQGTQLDSSLLVVASDAPFVVAHSRLTRIQDARDELDAMKRSLDTVFDMLDAYKNPEKGAALVVQTFGPALFDPPIEDVLNGQRVGDPSRYDLLPSNIAQRWLEAEKRADKRAAKAEEKLAQMEVDAGARPGEEEDHHFEDTKLDAALRGDLEEAFPDSFELLRRAEEESAAAPAVDEDAAQGPLNKRMRVAKVAAAAALTLSAAVREEDVVAAFDADGDTEMT